MVAMETGLTNHIARYPSRYIGLIVRSIAPERLDLLGEDLDEDLDIWTMVRYIGRGFRYIGRGFRLIGLWLD